MTGFQIWMAIIGSGGILTLLGSIIFIAFRTGKIIQKFNDQGIRINDLTIDMRKSFSKVDELFEKIDTRFDKYEQDLKEFRKEINEKIGKIDTSINIISVQIGKLETRVEERTLRVIHVPHEDKEMAVR